MRALLAPFDVLHRRGTAVLAAGLTLFALGSCGADTVDGASSALTIHPIGPIPIHLPHPPPFVPLAPKPPQPVLEPLATSTGCIIQSDFKSGDHGNFEVVVVQGHNAVHYWHDNANVNYTWHRGLTISSNATAVGPGCLIQSDFKAGSHGNFEVVIQEGTNLVHYWHDNSNPTSAWQQGQIIATGVTGPGAIIQSDFKSGSHGNFEVVVPVNGNLQHFWHDNSNVNLPWQPGQMIVAGVSGPGSIIQSDFKSGDHGNFEVVVPVAGNLQHWWHDNSDVNSPWKPGQMIVAGVGGPASIIQSDFKSGDHGNFEVVVPVAGNLQHWWHDNSDVNSPWKPGQTIATNISGPGSIIQSDFKGGSHGNFEVVVEAERAFVQTGAIVSGSPRIDQNLVHYFHDNSDVNLPWQRAQTITFRGRSEKLCQLTGDWDAERHQSTTSTTSRAGMSAVDLGYPVRDGDRLTFLFGDAFPAFDHSPYPESSPDDATAWTTSTSAPSEGVCPSIVVNNNAGTRLPPVVSPAIDQGWFDVPSSGFSTAEGLYTFFWTDHCWQPNDQTRGCDQIGDPHASYTGRSVLARSSDHGISYQQVGNVPAPFVYTASVNTDTLAGLPADQKRGVLVFGVPCYRNSTPYLASVPSSQADNVASWQYFDGLSGVTPTWSSTPTSSVPVFDAASDQLTVPASCSWNPGATHPDAGCIGEFSVDWSPSLHKWIMLYGCGASALEDGVRVRVADAPWGPWSDPTVIFNADNNTGDHGICHFMHQGDGAPGCDDVSDGVHGNDWGAVYAPFLLSQFSQDAITVPGGQQARLYYTLSTWNPYQVVIMKADLFLPQ